MCIFSKLCSFPDSSQDTWCQSLMKSSMATGAVLCEYWETTKELISVLTLEDHIVIELAPYHGAAPCAIIIVNPFSFFIDCQAKTSTSVTAHLAQNSFFAQIFLKGTRPKNHRQGVEICSPSTMNKLTWNNARQCQQEPDWDWALSGQQGGTVWLLEHIKKYIKYLLPAFFPRFLHLQMQPVKMKTCYTRFFFQYSVSLKGAFQNLRWCYRRTVLFSSYRGL